MAAILLFHHAQGLTAGVRAFADDLRAAGHDVNTPDLYDGNTFDDAELFVYPGDRHLFADGSLPDYDEAAQRCSRSGPFRVSTGSGKRYFRTPVITM